MSERMLKALQQGMAVAADERVRELERENDKLKELLAHSREAHSDLNRRWHTKVQELYALLD